MGPGTCFVRRWSRALHVPTLGPSRSPVAVRLTHVEPRFGKRLAVAGYDHVGHALRWGQVSRRCGPQGRATPYDPAERLGPRLGWRKRSGRPLSVGDAPHDAGDRNAIGPSGRTDKSRRQHLVSNSPERHPGRLVERPLYDQLPNQPGLDRLAKDLAACWLSIPIGGTREGGGALQERAPDAAL